MVGGGTLSALVISCWWASLESAEAAMPWQTDVIDWQMDSYLSNVQIKQLLTRIADDNRDIAKLYSIGKSIQGRDLWVVELSGASRSERVPVPNVKLIGTLHGDAPVGTQLVVGLIKYLVSRYRAGDNDIVWLMSNTRIHLMPTLNPDGFQKADEGHCVGQAGAGRGNAANQDLNRDFPGRPRMGQPPRFEQPETRALRRWMNSTQFVLSASIFGGEMVVSYPFDSHPEERPIERQSRRALDHLAFDAHFHGLDVDFVEEGVESETPDNDVFRHLAMTYARLNHNMAFGCNHNKQRFPQGIVNGAFWFPTSGTMQDYNYLYHGCFELALLISCCKYPSAHLLKNYWEDNYMALIKLIGESQRGVKGTVRDKMTGRPVVGATVSIQDTNRSSTQTTPEGYYWKLLLPGKYILKVEASNYLTKLEYFVVPKSQASNERKPVLLDIELERVPPPTEKPPSTTSSPSTEKTPPNRVPLFPVAGGPPEVEYEAPDPMDRRHMFVMSAVLSSSPATIPSIILVCLLQYICTFF